MISLGALKAAFALGSLVLYSGAVLGRAVIFGALTASFAASGLTLTLRGQADRRAVHLGVFFLLVGSSFADPLLVGAAAASGVTAFTALAYTQVAAFQTYYFWKFLRDFPRRIGPYVQQKFARACGIVALAIGVGLFGSNLALFLLPRHAAARLLLSVLDRHLVGSLYWPLLILPGLPVLPYIRWSARRASQEEKRRAGVLLAGIYAGIAPAMLLPLIEFVSPRALAFDLTPLGGIIVGSLVYPPLLSIPFSTAYAIIVHRALNVGLIIRKALRYAVMKSSIVLISLIPLVLILSIMYARREESLAQVTSGRIGIAILMLTLGRVLLSRFQPRLLSGLDERFFREQYNAYKILSELDVRQGTSLADIERRVTKALDDALHLRSASVLMMDWSEGMLATPSRSVRPLSSHATLVTDILSHHNILELESWRGTSSARCVPASELEWLDDADPRLVLAVRGDTSQLLGALLVGEKKSELPFSKEDRVLLSGVANAIGRALQNPPASSIESGASREALTPASECPRCGLVEKTDRLLCRECQVSLVQSAVPRLLSGKYQPLRRIGSGGMGVVYKAFDWSVSREVALKTLPKAAPFGAARMRREARAMAAVSHQHLESIHTAESWRGTPILIVEFLGGGTLAQRLQHARLDVGHALELGDQLGAALVRLHRAGILHRDIKPANIGFDSDGRSKLLDFGLAWMFEAAHVAPPSGILLETMTALTHTPSLALTATGQIIGTVPYLSPESINGEPATPSVDLWALNMVIYEALAGAHPLAGPDSRGVLKRILCEDVPDLRLHAHEVPADLASFLRDGLSRDISRRPQTASAWLDRFRAVRGAKLGSA
jgi:Serine/threonine protein kinase